MLAARVDESGREGTADVLAAIDIGTNSVHMVIARVAANDRFEVVTRQKEMVRLGSGRGEMKVLEPDAVDRGVAALARCRSLADSFGAEIKAVATSAVREARNAKE
ncbi:MAG: Ppx/GppA phosphatase family protein, partial [Actinomycetes bacterium]